MCDLLSINKILTIISDTDYSELRAPTFSHLPSANFIPLHPRAVLGVVI